MRLRTKGKGGGPPSSVSPTFISHSRPIRKKNLRVHPLATVIATQPAVNNTPSRNSLPGNEHKKFSTECRGPPRECTPPVGTASALIFEWSKSAGDNVLGGSTFFPPQRWPRIQPGIQAEPKMPPVKSYWPEALRLTVEHASGRTPARLPASLDNP